MTRKNSKHEIDGLAKNPEAAKAVLRSPKTVIEVGLFLHQGMTIKDPNNKTEQALVNLHQRLFRYSGDLCTSANLQVILEVLPTVADNGLVDEKDRSTAAISWLRLFNEWSLLTEANLLQYFRSLLGSVKTRPLRGPNDTLQLSRSAKVVEILSTMRGVRLSSEDLEPTFVTTKMDLGEVAVLDISKRQNPIWRPMHALMRLASHNEEALSLLVGVELLGEYMGRPALGVLEYRQPPLGTYFWEIPEDAVHGHNLMMYGILPASMESEALDNHFLANPDHTIGLICDLWDQIAHNFWQLPRREGRDRFTIQFGEKYSQTGYFLTEGTSFPGVLTVMELPVCDGVVFYAPRLIQPGDCEDLKIEMARENPGLSPSAYLGRLLAYHRIVCKEQHAPTGKGGCGVLGKKSDGRKRVPVRAHRRRLPEGHKPDPDAAKHFCEAFNQELPDGYTFVAECYAYRGGSRKGGAKTKVEGMGLGQIVTSDHLLQLLR